MVTHFFPSLSSEPREASVKMVSVPSHVRVCIIGAGVAGLGAAQRLIQSGVDDIVVLEADDRIGGRIHTIKHGK